MQVEPGKRVIIKREIRNIRVKREVRRRREVTMEGEISSTPIVTGTRMVQEIDGAIMGVKVGPEHAPIEHTHESPTPPSETKL